MVESWNTEIILT